VERHEIKARIDAKADEWKRSLDVMRAKAGTASGETRLKQQEAVSRLQEQFDELKIQSAKAWDKADDTWQAAERDLNQKWSEWELRAKSARNE
jgi:hypothetical protein